jgi:hypothetical protein
MSRQAQKRYGGWSQTGAEQDSLTYEMAMSVGSDTSYQDRRFDIDSISPRDFCMMNVQNGISLLTYDDIQQVFENIHQKMDTALRAAEKEMPDCFPGTMLVHIRDGMELRKQKIARFLNERRNAKKGKPRHNKPSSWCRLPSDIPHTTGKQGSVRHKRYPNMAVSMMTARFSWSRLMS